MEQPKSETDLHLIDSLAECGRLFFERGWSVGTSSNYSAVARREPLELWLTVSGKDKGRLNRSDFVKVDQDAKTSPACNLKSSAETWLHLVAAESEGVEAVLHTHSVWATLLSDHFFASGGFEITGYEMLKGLAGVTTHEHREWVDIFENTQDIPALAEQVKARKADSTRPPMHGYLIRNHGLYTWGKSIAEARRHIEVFEFLFECLGRRLMLN